MNENKNFADKTARAARETFEKGSAATQQSARGAQESFSAVAEGIRDFNVRLMEMAQLNSRGSGFCPRKVNREGASRRCGALVVACSEAIRDADRAVQGAGGARAKDRNLKRGADNAQLWSSAARVLLNASLLTDGKQSGGAYHTPRTAGPGRQERALLAQSSRRREDDGNARHSRMIADGERQTRMRYASIPIAERSQREA